MSNGWLRQRLAATWADRWIVLQIGVAAGLAWFVARGAISHTSAFFAPAAAVLVVSSSIGRQLRQTLELVAGVTVGLILADGLVHLLGHGPLQLALVVVLAASAALLVSGGKMVLNQATTTAVLIVALYPSAGNGVYYERWLGALIGAGVAFGVRLAIVPLRPLSAVRRSADVLRERLAEAFAGGRAGLDAADRGVTRAAAARLESAEPLLRQLTEDAERAANMISVALLHRRSRLSLAGARATLAHLDGAIDRAQVALWIEAEEIAAVAPNGMVEALARLARAVDEALTTLLGPSASAAAERAAARAEDLVGLAVGDRQRAAGELLPASRTAWPGGGRRGPV
ncbi:FUSC family protein [Asanoa sp. WMMD1127]|uniref:FUSC family protein n=1 Tax=Asanoa sp. WMMD1127 TaxID=3016107 RepID=UPI0024166EA8|nr:FUSC family protein [Asanoa sp. WMMD1127]MDG4824979.1 FUSC family protein [Asanoa sp. WMMD1127]